MQSLCGAGTRALPTIAPHSPQPPHITGIYGWFTPCARGRDGTVERPCLAVSPFNCVPSEGCFRLAEIHLWTIRVWLIDNSCFAVQRQSIECLYLSSGQGQSSHPVFQKAHFIKVLSNPLLFMSYNLPSGYELSWERMLFLNMFWRIYNIGRVLMSSEACEGHMMKYPFP